MFFLWFSDCFCGTTCIGTNSIRPLPQLDITKIIRQLFLSKNQKVTLTVVKDFEA
jgi:hypothetical protein